MKVKFELEVEKKHSVRYKEVGAKPVLGTIYVRKEWLTPAMKGSAFPKELEVTISIME